jgi:hypothetical protein
LGVHHIDKINTPSENSYPIRHGWTPSCALKWTLKASLLFLEIITTLLQIGASHTSFSSTGIHYQMALGPLELLTGVNGRARANVVDEKAIAATIAHRPATLDVCEDL